MLFGISFLLLNGPVVKHDVLCVLLIQSNREQARIMLGYCSSFFPFPGLFCRVLPPRRVLHRRQQVCPHRLHGRQGLQRSRRGDQPQLARQRLHLRQEGVRGGRRAGERQDVNKGLNKAVETNKRRL